MGERALLDELAEAEARVFALKRLIATGPCIQFGRFMESGLHNILKSYRVHGEWFRDEPLVREIFTQISTSRIWE